MKKLFLLIAFAGTSLFSLANVENYTIDDQKVDQLFAQSQDISVATINDMSSMNNINMSVVSTGGSQSVGGYLLRSFFCGGIALHRYYMGTKKKAMWAMYFCIPVVGGVAACVDFWWVVFKGSEAMNKYKGNDKYLVWAGK